MTDCDETFLAAGGVGVWESGRKRVMEDADRFIECDPVLPLIGVRLRTIPFEVHRLVGNQHGGIYRRALPRASGLQCNGCERLAARRQEL